MGLLDKLQTNGSTLSTNNGGTITTIPGGPVGNNLITNNSGLHADAAGNAGHSLDGSNINLTSLNYANYNDGIVNPLPAPSTIDLNGQAPTIAGHGNNTPGASTQALPYLQNAPN
tara:strand:+ start:36 stop:380 length:345 start_codon:yes stop_codon:yes gene_type:complete